MEPVKEENNDFEKKILEIIDKIKKYAALKEYEIVAKFVQDLNNEVHYLDDLVIQSNLCIKEGVLEILVDAIDYFYNFKLDKSINNFYVLGQLISFLSDLSDQTAVAKRKIHEKGGIINLVKYLTDDKIDVSCQKLCSNEQEDWKIKYNDEISMLYTSIFNAIYNTCRIADEYKNDFETMNITNAIRTFMNQKKYVKNIDEINVDATLTLAYVMTDKEIEKLDNIDNLISLLIEDYIKRCANQLLNNPNEIQRREMCLDENEDANFEIIDIFDGKFYWNLKEIIEALYRLAVNDQMKYAIYETKNGKEPLKTILKLGNEAEKALIMKLLYQLCFDKNVADLLKNDEILSYIKEISDDDNVKNKRLKHHTKGLIWLIEGKSQSRSVSPVQIDQDNNDDGHIMISYNSRSRDLCLKIKEELEKRNFKVWIDVEKIHGATLDSMADAIEKSKCVLVCVTEKYKLSTNCRLEAQYTHELQKPFVPLIMQQKYKPDGWLGMLVRSQIYVDFTKSLFEDNFEILLGQIQKVAFKNLPIERPLKVSASSTATKPISVPVEKDNAYNWNIEKVQAWANEKNLSDKIKEFLSVFDGKMLKEIFNLKKHSIEYFYKTMNQEINAKFVDIVKFSAELDVILN